MQCSLACGGLGLRERLPFQSSEVADILFSKYWKHKMVGCSHLDSAKCALLPIVPGEARSWVFAWPYMFQVDPPPLNFLPAFSFGYTAMFLPFPPCLGVVVVGQPDEARRRSLQIYGDTCRPIHYRHLPHTTTPQRDNPRLFVTRLEGRFKSPSLWPNVFLMDGLKSSLGFCLM